MKHLLMTLVLTSVLLGASAQKLKTVSYADGAQKLNGLVTSNAGKNLPGVLILPAWKGIDDEAKQQHSNWRNKATLPSLQISMVRETFPIATKRREK